MGKTAKKWKILHLLAWLLLVPGVVVFVLGYQTQDMGTSQIAVVMILVSFVLWLVGRVGAWWQSE